MERFITWVLKRRMWVLGAAVLVTVGLAANLRLLRIVIDPDDMLPRSHPWVDVTYRVADLFGNKFTVVIGVAPKTGDVFQPLVLNKVKILTDRLSGEPGVVPSNLMSLSADRAKDIRGTREGLDVKPLMKEVPQTPKEMDALKAALARNPSYTNLVISQDQQMATVVVEFQKDKLGFKGIQAKVEKIVAPLRDDQVEIHVAGAPVFLALLETFSERMGILFPLAVLIIGLIHYEAFRTFQGLILPLVTSLLAVVWAMGLMAVMRIPFDVFNTSTPILLLAVAAGHAVQILKRYYEEFHLLAAEKKHSPQEANNLAVIRSMTKIGPVMLAAGIIAAVSFMSLVTFQIQTIRTFGLFTGLGIMCALAVELMVIPALRSLLPPPSAKQMAREQSEALWNRVVMKLADWNTSARRKNLYLVVGGFALLMGVGASRVEMHNSLREDFYSNLEVRKTERFFNQKMAGTNTLYVLVEGDAEDAIKNPAVLKAMDDTQRFLEKDPQVGKTVSIADFIKRMNRAMHEDRPAFETIPDRQDLVAQYLLLYSMSGGAEDFDALVDTPYRTALIQVFIRDDDSAYIEDLAVRLKTFMGGRFPPGVKVEIGGGATSGTAMNQIMVAGKIRNIGQIALAVFLITALMFRSVLAGMMVLAPLAMAVLATFGVMGFLGIPLNIATATLSALAVGIGADYAIYFSYRLREELRREPDEALAVRNTYNSAGKATLYVSTAVAGGYVLLVTSYGFNIHLWFGILVSLAMLVSSLTALTLFPALLLTFRPAFVFGAKK
ncbi:MAG: MMPL family transporter [Deltaproteobacteria bacterium]|nr:MMPL family transporter [Deltaproteobacteria bacterium]